MQLSGSETVFLLIMGCLFAVVGYRLSENYRKVAGRTPWGLSSYLWALIWFLSLLLGLVLYLIARSTTKVDPSSRPASATARPRWAAGASAAPQPSSPLPGRYPSRVPPDQGGVPS